MRYLDDDYDGSMADIAQTLKREPRHLGALMGMATILEARGKREEALRSTSACRPSRRIGATSKSRSKELKGRTRWSGTLRAYGLQSRDMARGVTLALTALAALLAALWTFTAVQTWRIGRRYPAVGERVYVGGGALHVVERAAEGEERGAAVLIHGASGNFADMSVALGERLSAKGFRVVCVDRPGHGWSERIFGREAASPVRQAELLLRAADELGVREAIVVAHSLAGAIGLAMALDAPQFVRALVLVAPVSHPWPGRYRLVLHGRRASTSGAAAATLDRAAGRHGGHGRGGAVGVCAPNPAPPRIHQATRLPLGSAAPPFSGQLPGQR